MNTVPKGYWQCGLCSRSNPIEISDCQYIECSGHYGDRIKLDLETPLKPGNWRCGKCRKENEPTSGVCSCNDKPSTVEPPESFEDAVEEVVGDLMLVMYSKQRDYGRGNIDAFGEVGVLVRASDKLARLKNLLYDNPGSTPKNESVIDTWGDLANYAIIALMIRRGWWGLPLIESGLSPDSMEDKDNE